MSLRNAKSEADAEDELVDLDDIVLYGDAKPTKTPRRSSVVTTARDISYQDDSLCVLLPDRCGRAATSHATIDF